MGATTMRDQLEEPPEDGNIYARVWHFVQRQLHLRPRAASCPDEREAREGVNESASPRRRWPRCLSDDRTAEYGYMTADSQWSRVAMLKQVEAVHLVRPDERARRRRCYYVDAAQQETGGKRARVQGKCLNCDALFFRALAGAQTSYCGRDCQSSFEYRRLVQDVVDGHELRGGSAVQLVDTLEPEDVGGAIAIARRPPAF